MESVSKTLNTEDAHESIEPSRIGIEAMKTKRPDTGAQTMSIIASVMKEHNEKYQDIRSPK